MGKKGIINGQTLVVEDLEATLKRVTYEDKHLKFWPQRA